MKNNESYYRSRRLHVFNKFWTILNNAFYIETFSLSISVLLGPSWFSLGYFLLYLTISDKNGISRTIPSYLRLSWAILCYMELSWLYLDIMIYLGYIYLVISGHLSQLLAISDCMWLSLAIFIEYQVSGCNKKQEWAIYCYFKTKME